MKSLIKLSFILPVIVTASCVRSGSDNYDPSSKLSGSYVGATNNTSNKKPSNPLTGDYVGLSSSSTVAFNNGKITSTSDTGISVDGIDITFADLMVLKYYKSKDHFVVITDFNNQYSHIGIIGTPILFNNEPSKKFVNFFTYGEDTSLAQIPTSGVVEYSGDFITTLSDIDARGATYRIDFSNKKLAGTLMGYDENNTLPVNIEINANITGNTFSGTAQIPTGRDLFLGDVDGRFYGPNAKELAGTINALKDHNNDNKNWMAAFIGKQ